MQRRNVLKSIASTAAASTLASGEAFARDRAIIRRDLVIVGGGGAGTYAALRARDLGHSVVVIEKSGRVGGHCQTFHDPKTGTPIDIGVIFFPDNSLVRNYFGRFGVPLVTAPLAGGANLYVDFRTGLPVDAYQPSGTELGGALLQYLQILTTRFGFLELTGFQLPGPGPLLDELLQPFGKFVKDNGLSALLPLFFLFEQGYGSLLEATTLYVLKNMSAAIIGSILGGSFLMAPLGAEALYEGARVALGDDVLLDTNVLEVERCERAEVRLTVQTREGVRTILAKKLLVTAPPVLANFAGYDLDFAELATFARFDRHHYWTAVAKLNGMPVGTSLVNTAPSTPYNLAPLPGLYSIGPSAAPGLFNVKYGSTEAIPSGLVRAAIRADIERVRVPGVGRIDFESYAIFKDHSPYSVTASPREIRSGFYRQLNALQGRNNTFYAGAAFQTHNSAAIWAYVEELLPRLFA